MALGTATKVSFSAANGPIFIDRITLVGDGSYPTNGSAGVQAKLKGLTKDSRDIISMVDEGVGTYKAEYDKTNDKLKVFVRATGVEVANATDLSGTTFKLCFTSK